MRRVLVTGSAGFIGWWVREELAAAGIVAVPYDRPHSVLDRATLDGCMQDVDGVINLAGVLGTSETFGAEYDAAYVNILGALNVYNSAAHYGVPVVQVGTGHKGQPNPYAITKACAEDLGLARAEYLGERIIIVRAFHAYGGGQKATAPHGPSPVRKIIPTFVCRALTGMNLEINGDGSQLIDLVHVEDVAKALVRGLSADPGAIIEAGTGKPTTVIEAARTIIEACSSTSGITFIPARLGEPEGATVVAQEPACMNAWPYLLDETVTWYRRSLQ